MIEQLSRCRWLFQRLLRVSEQFAATKTSTIESEIGIAPMDLDHDQNKYFVAAGLLPHRQ